MDRRTLNALKHIHGRKQQLRKDITACRATLSELEAELAAIDQVSGRADRAPKTTNGGGRRPRTRRQPNGRTAPAKVLAQLNGEAVKVEVLARRMNGTNGAVRNSLYQLVKEGKAERVGRGLYRKVAG